MNIIVVRYDSEVLGLGEFWRGPSERIEEIRNVPARRLARDVVRDGRTRTDGMWTVSMESSAGEGEG